MILDKGEELVGVSGDPDDEIFITSTNINKTYCTACKRREHCIHGIITKQGKETIMLKVKCTNPACECRCRRFFQGKDGKLRHLGTVDNSDPLEGFSSSKREAIDDVIDMINAQVKAK